ncbi:hypothetical protein IGI04_029959 [Brassica rapa subsp. trilocularis]|uniref:Uncharacterized protein n=1 Tax=Brassica rapa subsp. trilocularis TaxID=1813537 RepID=A0ABQ7LPC4_BRACM|nr:hypothetical protein IGI04_029959 [Brassica rapa subsp. trilocularis]
MAASKNGTILEAVPVNNLGKWKTATQMSTLTILIVSRDRNVEWLSASGVGLLYVSGGLSVKMFEAEQRRLFSQFEVQEFCDNLVEGVVKALKDISKIHKKSTSTRAPVAEPSIFISEEPKEVMESLITCEDECDLPSPKPDLMFDIDNEETNGLTCFEPEHPSSLVLVSHVFEEEPLDYPHQGPRIDTKRPLDDGLGPIFDEEDELGPTFDEKAPSMTSINMENHLCFDLGTTPTSLPTGSQEHLFEPDKLSDQKRFQNGNNIHSDLVLSFDQFLKHSKGFDHLEKSLELGLQQLVFCARKSFDSFVFKENSFDLSFHKHEMITGDVFASTCALDKLMIFKTLLEQKSPRVETDFCDSVLKLDILYIVVYNTFFEKHIEPLISDSQSEFTLLCSDFEKDRHVLKKFSIMLYLDTILICNAYFDVNFERLKRVLHVLGKETLISYSSKYMSCTYDSGILVSVLTIQDKQVQSQRNVKNKSIDRAYQPEIWRCIYSRKMASKLQGKEGNDAPRIIDPGQDVVTMAEPDDSSTKDKPGWINGEHTDLIPAGETEDELEPAEENMHELKPAEVRVYELSELSDTSLELNELSDTEDGADLVAGRNGPFSAQRKIHNKFNLGRFCTKFDQTFSQSISSSFSSRIPRGNQQGSLGRAWKK